MANRKYDLLDGGDSMGMTDAQFKTHLRYQSDDLQRLLELAIRGGNKDIQTEIERQIAKVNDALEF